MNSKPGRQSGVSLVELMVSMVISLIVSMSMVGLMVNTLGTGTTTIQMTHLSAEIRTVLQIMSRDVRRANYHGNFIKCFGNLECRTSLDTGDADATGFIKSVSIDDSVATDESDCFFFWYDRNSNGNVTTDNLDYVGAFRRALVNGVGVIEMTTDQKTTPSCTSGTYWTAITDPNVINVTDFTVSNSLSYTDTITAADDTQTVDKISMSITAELTRDTSISKTFEEVIRVRNDIFAAAP